MKPIDKERREVAARLRDFESLREMFKESNMCAFSNALGVGYMDWEHICARLADLIEPAPERTCRAEVRHCDGDGMGCVYLVCSACGETLRYREAAADDGEPDYELLPHCAGCGARVEGAAK